MTFLICFLILAVLWPDLARDIIRVVGVIFFAIILVGIISNFVG